MTTPFDRSALLGHVDFVRTLARQLVGAGADASDLEQETWLRALRRPPRRAGEAEGFLATIMRNAWRQSQRSGIRRQRREKAAAGSERIDVDAHALDRQRLIGDVGRALEELSTEQRTAIVLRFYEGLPVRDVAARTGAPAETVRTRIKRGLERMRHALDRHHGGDRAAWLVPLASWAKVAPKGVGTASGVLFGGLMMSLQSKLVLAGLGLVVAAFVIVSVKADSASDMEPVVVPIPRAATAGTTAPAGPEADGGIVTTPFAKESRPRRSVPPEITPDLGRDALFKGRVFWEDGSPAVRVSVRLHGWWGNRRRPDPVAEAWKDGETLTDDEGRFSLRFTPPTGFQFSADIRGVGHARARWRWSSVPAGETKDVGDVRLRRSGVVSGMIVDADGRAVRGRWTIYADGPRLAGEDREGARELIHLDERATSFRVEGLPAGPVTFTAWAPGVGSIEEKTVTVRAGQEMSTTLRYAGADPARQISLSVRTRSLFRAVAPLEGTIRLLSRGEEIALAKKVPKRVSDWVFEDVPPGEYDVVVDSPAYLPFRRAGVRPGDALRMRLVGSAALQVIVTDSATGKAVEDYALRVRYGGHVVATDHVTLRRRGVPLPDGGVYAGLVPGNVTVVVDAEGWPLAEVDVPSLQGNIVRPVEIGLGRGRVVGGVVRRGDLAQVVPGVEVALYRIIEGAPGTPSMSVPRWTRSDAKGRFVFTGVPKGTWLLCCREGELVTKAVRVRIESNSGPAVRARLRFPELFPFTGRLLAPAGASWDGLRIGLHRQGDLGSGEVDADSEASYPVSALSEIGEDGRFRIGPVAAGSYLLAIDQPDPLRHVPTRMGVFAPSPINLGPITIGPGATLHKEIDLGKRTPGFLRVSGTLNGKSLAGLTVLVVRARDRRYAVNGVRLDAKGRGKIGPVPPGAYRLLVQDPDGVWLHLGERCVVPAGGVAEGRVDVVTTPGTLRLVNNATGDPLTGRLALRLAGLPATAAATLDPDEEGRLRMDLPAGRYFLHRVDQDGKKVGRKKTIEWTAGGPVPSVLAL